MLTLWISLLSLVLKVLLCVKMIILCQWMLTRCKKANSLHVEDVVDLFLVVVVHVVLPVLLVVVVSLHVDLIIVYVVVLVVVVCRPMQTHVFTVVNLAIGHVSVSRNNVIRLA